MVEVIYKKKNTRYLGTKKYREFDLNPNVDTLLHNPETRKMTLTNFPGNLIDVVLSKRSS